MSRTRGSSVRRIRVGVGILLCLIPLMGTACGRSAEEGQEEKPAPAHSREVRLSEDAARAAGIKVIPVSREAFHPHIVASGVIRPVSSKSVRMTARVAGRVVRVLADVGDRVKAGQTLATLEGSEVTAALARHRTGTVRKEAARKSLERAERLLDMQAISRAEVELRRAESEAVSAEADAARQELMRLGLDPDAMAPDPGGLSEFPILAPLSGVVLERTVAPGLLVEREATLFEIADLATVWAVVDVYEKDLGQLQERGEVEVRTDAYPGVIFTGRIALVEPALDEASRTAHVRVVLDNSSKRLRPGLFVTVAVPLRGASEVEATVVPDGAGQKFSGLTAVFVEKSPGLFELRPVETGQEAHGVVEIRHGLQAGERVVVEGAFILKSELLKGTIGAEED